MQFDQLQSRRKPRRVTVPVVLDDTVLRRVRQLERDIRLAKRRDALVNEPDRAPLLEAEKAQLEEDAEDAAVWMTFQALPRREYRALLAAHPSDEDGKDWDEDTFAPALIAACYVGSADDPDGEPDGDMTVEQAATAFHEWDETQAYVMFAGALDACQGAPQIPLSARSSGRTAASG